MKRFVLILVALASCVSQSPSSTESTDGGLVNDGGFGAPLNLSAASISTSSILLAWDPHATAENLVVERRKGLSEEFLEIVTLSGDEANYLDDGLAAATAYTYRIAATSQGETSPYSNYAGAVTRADSDAPSAPTALTGWAVSTSEIALVWHDNATDETGFVLERRGDDGIFADVGTADVDATSIHDTDLAAGAAHTYRVRATGAESDSDPSNEVTLATNAESAPEAPTDLVATALSSSSIDLSWVDNADNEDSFVILRAQGTAAPLELVVLSADTTGYSDEDLSPATLYSYRVFARNDGGDSDYSDYALATTWDETTGDVGVVALVGGASGSVATKGDWVFMGEGAGLVVYDVSDPSSPENVAMVPLFEPIQSLAVAEDRLAAAAGDMGLVIWDVSDPTLPEITATVDTEGSATDVAQEGDIAYVADGTKGLSVIGDLPGAPSLLGSYDTTGSAVSVASYGSYVYLADGSGGLVILDVSDPGSPALVEALTSILVDGELALFEPKAVAVGAGPNLYVANPLDTWSDGLFVFSLTDPENPDLQGQLNLYALLSDLVTKGSYVYAFKDSFGAAAVDASDPAAPVPMSYLYANDLRDLALGDQYAYVANGYGGLVVFDMGDTGAPDFPIEMGSVPSFGASAKSLLVDGSRLYLADGTSGIAVLDISGAIPQVIEISSEVYDTNDAVFHGDTLYVADGYDGLVILESSDEPLARIASASLPNESYAVAIIGTHAVVAAGASGALVVDVDPLSPSYVTQVGDYALSLAVDVVASGESAFVAAMDDGLVVLDVSDPEAPTLLGQYDEGAVEVIDVALVGDVAYLSCGPDGIRLVDTSLMTLIGSHATSGDATGVVVTDKTAWVATSEGVEIVDISSEPTLVGQIDVGGAAQAIATDGSYIYVAVPELGIAVIEAEVVP